MTEDLQLSKRLKVIADQIKSGDMFLDIGSDHAYLPCFICSSNKNILAIAGEVQPGPFENAKRTVKKYGLQEQINVRMGDGLSVLSESDNINTVVIAGMGGQLITNILRAGESKLALVDKLILQPNTDENLVREYLYQSGYSIQNEFIIEDNNVIYELIIATKADVNVYDDAIAPEKQFLFGPILMQQKDLLFKRKWQNQLKHLQSVLNQLELAKKLDLNKTLLIKQQINWIKEVLE